MNQVGRGVIAGSGVFRGLGRAVAFASGGFLGAAGLTAAVRSSFQEMAESARVSAQTAAVLKSTGGAAGVTAKHVEALGTSLLKLTGTDDEAVRSMENILLTFTSVRNAAGKGNDIFDQATKLTLDLSVALGQDLNKSAIQVGKALNDPERGLTALRRVGVAFTDEQQKQIKTLVASGRTMQAQKIVLGELRREFGGSAAAAGRTFPGQINKLRETLKNLGASMLTQLIPAITRIVNRLNAWFGNTKNQQRIQRDFREIVRSVSSVLRTMAAVLARINRVTRGLGNTIKILIGIFIAFKALRMAAAVAEVGRSFGLLGRRARGAGGGMRNARGGARSLRLGLIGKAGLVGAVGVAAFALTRLILKVTGLDKKLRSAGGAAFDLAAKVGLVNDPTSQFKGKTTPTQDNTRFIRNRLARLERGGLTPQEAADQFLRTHPNLARHDVEVLAGVNGTPPVHVTVHSTTNVDGKPVAKTVTKHQRRAKARRSNPRTGPYAGRN